MSDPPAGDVLRVPFQEAETIIITEPRGQRHFVQLKLGDKFHHRRTGHISHEEIIGSPPGAQLMSEQGVRVVCLRLTLEDFILKKLRRRTSIIHPKDLATLLVRGDVYPGARVLEAGLGSGATSLILLRFIGRTGTLTSYERREEFVDPALDNIRAAHSLLGDPGATHQVKVSDLYDGIEEEDLDLVLLDVPEPHCGTSHVYRALRPGGVFLSWLPTVTQVYQLVLQLKEEACWSEVETRETLQRSWEVSENAMRPFHRMVGHTGFLIRTRKLSVGAGTEQV
ncbi:MAG TPA: tRNA (adenine-N1)-methyltransferase [Acidobacteriota bacterium]|nr:tRNA (adenine-N1)-methyltransferase [Acidobacteriota bacterium]